MKNNINLAVKYYPDENKSIINNSNKVIKAIDLIILLIILEYLDNIMLNH